MFEKRAPHASQFLQIPLHSGTCWESFLGVNKGLSEYILMKCGNYVILRKQTLTSPQFLIRN